MTLPAAIGLALALGSAGPAMSAGKPADFGTMRRTPGATARLEKTTATAPVVGATTVSAALAITNTALCTAAAEQSAMTYIPDGNGGGIAVWVDERDGDPDVWAQKMDANGAPVWAFDGVPVCKAAGFQIRPRAVSDGSGGAIVMWEDWRTDAANPDIYAQRISSAGVEMWAVGGVVVCAESGPQETPIVAPDGVGGAIAVWSDRRGASADLYAQRVNAAGIGQWTAGGVVVCGASGTQDQATVVPDGQSGVMVAWRDQRAGSDIYARRVGSNGTALWTADGNAVCAAAGTQETPAAIPDGTGGVILAWSDGRGADRDVYVQRLDGAGVLSPGWTADGVALCAAAGDQTAPQLCSDAAYGAVATWEDRRGANADIYAQRVSSAGAPQWAANGVSLCTSTGDQLAPTIAADPTGAALVTWSDGRTPANGADIVAQRITFDGAVSWTADGVLACDTTGDQLTPQVLADGQGGAHLAWRDLRGGPVADLYSQRVESGGQIPAQCASFTALTASTVVNASAVNTYYQWTQDSGEPYWAGAGVRSANGDDWDLELYSGNTFGGSAYPVCFSDVVGGSYLTSGVDYVVSDFNDGHTPAQTEWGVRVTRYSGASTGAVEYDGGIDIASKDCGAGGSCGANSKNNWTGVIDVWDLLMFAGQNYTFDFTRTGSADIKMALFSSAGTTGPFFAARSSRVFECSLPLNPTKGYMNYACTSTGWYGLAFVNDNGVAGTYSAHINTGVTTGVGDGPVASTGLKGVIPNPARGMTRIQFALERPGEVSMRVVDMAGRAVGEIAARRWGAGSWSVPWDGRSKAGGRLPAGVYFVEMLLDGQRVGRSRLALLH